MSEYIAAVIEKDEIVDSFDGNSIEEAAEMAVGFFMTEQLDEIKVVIHEIDSEDVVEAFTIKSTFRKC